MCRWYHISRTKVNIFNFVAIIWYPHWLKKQFSFFVVDLSKREIVVLVIYYKDCSDTRHIVYFHVGFCHIDVGFCFSFFCSSIGNIILPYGTNQCHTRQTIIVDQILASDLCYSWHFIQWTNISDFDRDFSFVMGDLNPTCTNLIRQ